MNDPLGITIPDENVSSSSETPILANDKLKDIITENSISTSTVSSTNGLIVNTPPFIKHKLPKLPITAGKPLR